MPLPFKKILIVGLGLIGGSIAKLIKKEYPSIQVYACDKDSGALNKALESGWIDAIDDGSWEIAPDADLIVLAAPPAFIPGFLQTLQDLKYSGTVTDVASIKHSIAQFWIQREGMESSYSFVSSHPMAGSEKTGLSASRYSLFQDAACILTCYPGVPNVMILGDMSTFWIRLGCNTPVIMYPDDHDAMIGVISHFPHLVATMLMHIAQQQVESSSLLKAIVGPGFKDTTRIAQGNPELWREILFENRTIIKTFLDRLANEIDQLRTHVMDDPDKIQGYLEEAALFRKRIQSKYQ